MDRRAFIVVLALGAALRIFGLASPGSGDVRLFRVWAFHAATGDLKEIYGVGGWPPERRLLAFSGDPVAVDYPPVAVYHLAAVGRLYQRLFPTFPDGQRLTLAIKAWVIGASMVLTLLIWWVVNARYGTRAANLAAVLYWANPAVILHGAVLGYVGTLAFLPAVAALLAAAAGRPGLTGALFAIACLTKPQGVFVGPALAVALMSAQTLRPLKTAVLTAAATAGLLVAPFIIEGALPNMARAVGGLVTDGVVSGQAANLWWIVGYVVHVVRTFEMDGLAALGSQPPVFTLSEFFAKGELIEGRSIGTLAVTALSWSVVVAIVAWAARLVRGRAEPEMLFALTSLTVHAYFVFAVQVHENHMAFTLPGLAVLAAERRAYRGLMAAVTAIVALNLYVVHGFGEGMGFALPSTITPIDATVLLAAANVLLLCWHVRVFGRVLGAGDARGPSGGSRTHVHQTVRLTPDPTFVR